MGPADPGHLSHAIQRAQESGVNRGAQTELCALAKRYLPHVPADEPNLNFVGSALPGFMSKTT